MVCYSSGGEKINTEIYLDIKLIEVQVRLSVGQTGQGLSGAGLNFSQLAVQKDELQRASPARSGGRIVPHRQLAPTRILRLDAGRLAQNAPGLRLREPQIEFFSRSPLAWGGPGFGYG